MEYGTGYIASWLENKTKRLQNIEKSLEMFLLSFYPEPH